MRIAVVTETYPPEVNGVALTVYSLVSQMAADGHNLLLVRPRQPGVSAMPLARPVSELLVSGAALPKYPGLRFGFPAGRLLARHFGTRRPDAVYVATEGPLGWSAVRAASRLGIPVATGFHTRFDAYAGAYGLGPLTPLVRRWLRRLHNASGATVVPTEELRQWLEERGFERVRVVARGVDTELFDPARRDPQLRARWGVGARGLAVIHVGRIAAEKNLELAIEAFRLIRQQRPDARFVWVGTGPLAARLKREHPDFIFTGLRLGEDLAAHFASADLFLFPSLTETFGNVTIEAMAAGVPTVAFDYGAARAHIKDGVHGRLVACGDEPGFVGAAVQAATDDAARRTMGVAARRAAHDGCGGPPRGARAEARARDARVRRPAREPVGGSAGMTSLPAVEMPLCLALNRWGARSLVHGFFATISRLGDGVFWYALMASLALAGGMRGAMAAVHLAVTGLVALALYRLLKRHIRRPRPCEGNRGVVALVAPLDRFSFPSGHTLHAVAFAAVACGWFPSLAVLLVPFALLVALSRVVLGLHYPSDVLAAIVIGLVLATGSLAGAEYLGIGAGS